MDRKSIILFIVEGVDREIQILDEMMKHFFPTSEIAYEEFENMDKGKKV